MTLRKPTPQKPSDRKPPEELLVPIRALIEMRNKCASLTVALRNNGSIAQSDKATMMAAVKVIRDHVNSAVSPTFDWMPR